MALDILFLVISLGIILGSCYVFVNAVECFGEACCFHQGIVGSILAAVGTALPETIIPIIAILFSQEQSSHDVGIGAIAGAPFMLSTLGFFVTGLAVIVYAGLGKRSIKMKVDTGIISKDLRFFLIIYGMAIATTLVHEIIWLKCTVAVLLLISYIIYFRQVVGHNAEMVENVDALYLHRWFKLPPNKPVMVIQILGALGIMVFGADMFINYVQTVSAAVGMAPLILSLIITPIATELPEKLNSIIWVGRKKATLALGNITGAMVFQSCFPVVFGMLFTRWELRGMTLVSAIIALSSALIYLLWMRIFKTINPYIMLMGGCSYLVFIGFIVAGVR